MQAGRTIAILLRQFYLIRGSVARLLSHRGATPVNPDGSDLGLPSRTRMLHFRGIAHNLPRLAWRYVANVPEGRREGYGPMSRIVAAAMFAREAWKTRPPG